MQKKIVREAPKMDVYQLAQQCIEAGKRIRPPVRHTPIEYSYWLSSLQKDSKVYMKWESEQISGSAKARGSFNKLMILKEENPDLNEAIAASTGNHGAACSLAMNILGIRNGRVYVPTMAEQFKCDMIQQYGSTLEKRGGGCAEAESLARVYSEEKHIPYISPSNDWDVLAGQGSIGCEIFEDLPSVDAVFISVGGGGIIAGVAAYLKTVKPDIKLVGCETDQSPAMSESLKAGHIVEVPNKPTLSDGTAGGVEKGNITFELCQKLVDEWVIVTEEEIAKAIYDTMEHHHKIVEGSAGLSIAAYIKTKEKYHGKTVVVLSCGSNISISRIKNIINTYG